MRRCSAPTGRKLEGRQCTRKATVEYDGYDYCWQHFKVWSIVNRTRSDFEVAELTIRAVRSGERFISDLVYPKKG